MPAGYTIRQNLVQALVQAGQRRKYAAVITADDIKPLAIAGMLENNLRVRGCAINYLAEKFGLDLPGIDFAADDAPSRMETLADTLLKAVRADAKYSDYS